MKLHESFVAVNEKEREELSKVLNTVGTIDLATKRYGRVTMVLSEKLYDDDYKYIYLKAVVEVLSELDEEWGRYAREVYLVEQRLQKVFSSCSKKYPSTSDGESYGTC